MSNQMERILTKSEMTSDDVKSVIEIIDQESANSVYTKCADELGFLTAHIDGNVYSITKELAPVFGYANQEAVSKVISKHGIETFAITGFVQNGQHLIRQALNLSTLATRIKLIDYRGFLTIALKGQGDECDKVREYLLSMEKRARVDTIVYEETGMIATDLIAIGENISDPIIQGAMERIKIAQDMMSIRSTQLHTDKRIGQLENKIEDEFPITSEQEHILNQKRDELIELKSLNGMSRKRAYPWFYSTIKSRFRIGLYSGMSREKFPLAVEWIESRIEKEQAKLAQLQLL